MVTKETEHYKKLKLENKDWKKWENVKREFVDRMMETLEKHKVLLDTHPEEIYGLAQEKLMAYQVFGEVLYDIFYTNQDVWMQVTIEESPGKVYAARKKEEET